MLSFSRFAAVTVFALGLMAFQDPAGRHLCAAFFVTVRRLD